MTDLTEADRKFAQLLYDELEGPIANQDASHQMRQWETCLRLVPAARSARDAELAAVIMEAEGVLIEAIGRAILREKAAKRPEQKTFVFPGNLSRDILASIRPHIAALAAENVRLTKLFASFSWYWDADDREISASCPGEILDNYDWGDVAEIERGGVVETRFMAWLPPAPDADSDDNFEVDCATLEEAEAAIKAETDRRAALGGDNG